MAKEEIPKRKDQIIYTPGSPEAREQEREDAAKRLVEPGLGGEATYPWGSPVPKE